MKCPESQQLLLYNFFFAQGILKSTISMMRVLKVLQESSNLLLTHRAHCKGEDISHWIWKPYLIYGNYIHGIVGILSSHLIALYALVYCSCWTRLIVRRLTVHINIVYQNVSRSARRCELKPLYMTSLHSVHIMFPIQLIC